MEKEAEKMNFHLVDFIILSSADGGIKSNAFLYLLLLWGMFLAVFIIAYLLICLVCIAYPSNGFSEVPEVDLRSPWDRILFLPLAKGKLRGYMLHAVFLQAANYLAFFANIVLALLMTCGVGLTEKAFDIPYIAALGIAFLGFIISVAIMIRNNRKRFPRRGRRRR